MNLYISDVVADELVLSVTLEIHTELGEEDLKPIRRECGMGGLEHLILGATVERTMRWSLGSPPFLTAIEFLAKSAEAWTGIT